MRGCAGEVAITLLGLIMCGLGISVGVKVRISLVLGRYIRQFTVYMVSFTCRHLDTVMATSPDTPCDFVQIYEPCRCSTL